MYFYVNNFATNHFKCVERHIWFVFNACHGNPISMVIPCHRIIGASGNLTGYGGGIDIKAWLLGLETKHTHGL
jgi:O6-methylguanine-DNA--protein-cysteine methyltransferase